MRMLAVLVVLFAAACAAVPGKDPRARHLDALFAQLRSAPDEATARRLEEDIRSAWRRSDDPTVDAAMAQAIEEAGNHEYDRALAILDDVVGRAPRYAEGWNTRATLLFFMGRLDRSLADIERTLALEPRHFGALAGRALIHIRRGERAQAAASIRAAMAIDPYLRERELLPGLE